MHVIVLGLFLSAPAPGLCDDLGAIPLESEVPLPAYSVRPRPKAHRPLLTAAGWLLSATSRIEVGGPAGQIARMARAHLAGWLIRRGMWSGEWWPLAAGLAFRGASMSFGGVYRFEYLNVHVSLGEVTHTEVLTTRAELKQILVQAFAPPSCGP